MVHIPQTHKKLREAKFFLHRLLEKAKAVIIHDSEEFGFYLSAFLNAGYSVPEVLRTENSQSAQSKREKNQRKKWYQKWLQDWEKELTPTESELWEFADDQRGREVHRKGAEVKPNIEDVPLSEIPVENRDHPAYGVHVSGPPEKFSTPPPKIGLRVYYFELAGAHEKTTKICRRYLELLEKLVHGFEQSQPP